MRNVEQQDPSVTFTDHFSQAWLDSLLAASALTGHIKVRISPSVCFGLHYMTPVKSKSSSQQSKDSGDRDFQCAHSVPSCIGNIFKNPLKTPRIENVKWMNLPVSLQSSISTREIFNGAERLGQVPFTRNYKLSRSYLSSPLGGTYLQKTSDTGDYLRGKHL